MKSQRIALFTIASKNYLAHVRVLLRSVAAQHPEYRLYLCLADEAAPQFDPHGEPYEVVQADALGIPSFDDMAVRYDIMEFNTAVKPFMIRWLLDNTDADAAIYLDPDICVYSPLTAIEERFAGGDAVVLTPHITRALEDGRTPNDHHMLQSGVFNLGFIGVRRCDEALRFVDWWGRRMATQAVSDVRNNLFTDQRWCDLAPCFVDRLAVLKDPGYNVAYWNLSQRDVRADRRGRWQVNGQPLAFFHFSGVNIDRRDAISKHQDRLTWSDVPQLRPLFDDYFQALHDQGNDTVRRWPYAYAQAGGLAMSPLLRLLYRQTYPEAPRSARAAVAGLTALANEAAPGIAQDDSVRVTRLMQLVYTLRPDVQATFSLATPAGRRQFFDWFAQAGTTEYQLQAALMPPALSALTLESTPTATIVLASSTSPPADSVRQNLALRWKALTPAARLKSSAAFLALLLRDGATTRNSSALNESGEPLAQSSAPPATAQVVEQPQAHITRLMGVVWRMRSDLQIVFDLNTVEGRAGYRDWCRSGALAEYGPHINAQTDLPPEEATAPDRIPGDEGVNLVGYTRAEIGMGEHVRMTAAALQETGIPFGMIDVPTKAGRQHARIEYGQLIDQPRYRANLLHVNADQMLHLYGQFGGSLFSDRYNIGYWAWELSRWPGLWQAAFEFVDEIWAPSEFIRDAIAAATTKPVRAMPLCVALPTLDVRYDRRHFGIDHDAFVFLYTFDFQSYMERKNPQAAVLAFRKAFPRRTEKVRLLLKTMHGQLDSPAWQALDQAIDGDNRISVINRTMDRNEVLALCAASDAFVSLHRAEGFGRGPAEAMALGKPVIVTGYSGNMAFTKPDTACLVDYQLIAIQPGEYPLHDGQVWADPDVAHAALQMRRLVDDSAFAHSIGCAGQAFIATHFNQRAVGARYAARLSELGLAS